MIKPDLSKPAKYRLRNKNWLWCLDERRTWWLFSWYTNILKSPSSEEILEKVRELEGKPYKNGDDEIVQS